MTSISLDGHSLTIEQVVSIARDYTLVRVRDSAKEKVKESRRSIERLLHSGKVYYGINTGFGKLADTLISPGDVEKLQTNLIRSHSVGLGASLAAKGEMTSNNFQERMIFETWSSGGTRSYWQ